MKKKIFKFFKIILIVISIPTLTIAVGIIWPTSKITTPDRFHTVLIKSIHIIDVHTGAILENRNILIEKNKIIRIDSANISVDEQNTLQIDGTGKYAIPGLWDMHTHSNQHSPWLHHPIYIANGVTGIRDMSGQLNRKDSYWVGSKERLKWNAELNANQRVSPRYILQSSYQIDGPSSVPDGFPNYFKLNNTNQVDSLLGYYKNENVDFIKIYQQIPVESYKKLARNAQNYGLHIAGHKPMFLSLEEAVKLGQRSFEHGRIFLFESFPETDSLKKPHNWKSYFSKNKKKLVEQYNPETAHKLMNLMHAENAHWVPTLQTLKFEASAHKKEFLDNPNLKYVTSVRKNLWWKIDANNNAKRNQTENTKGVSEKFYTIATKQIQQAHDIGVPIMTGTDVTDSYTFAGFSVHDELMDLTKCGLTNLEALKTATIIPAKYAHKNHLFGSIEKGKMADLILLNRNPLQDISNTKEIYGVLINGVFYDTQKLEELKTFTASQASSFHMNVKTLFSLFNSPLIRVQFAD